MFSNVVVAPEQKKALSVLEKSLPFEMEILYKDPIDPEAFLIDDHKFFYTKSITIQQLPRGNWFWNQSRTRQTVCDNSEKLCVSFYKLNTRRISSNSEPAPPYKVWVYHITFVKDDREATFFWCERGKKPDCLDDNLLKSLSFLRPHVSESTATEFGWVRQEGYYSPPNSRRETYYNVKNTGAKVDYSNFKVFHGNT